MSKLTNTVPDTNIGRLKIVFKQKGPDKLREEKLIEYLTRFQIAQKTDCYFSVRIYKRPTKDINDYDYIIIKKNGPMLPLMIDEEGYLWRRPNNLYDWKSGKVFEQRNMTYGNVLTGEYWFNHGCVARFHHFEDDFILNFDKHKAIRIKKKIEEIKLKEEVIRIKLEEKIRYEKEENNVFGKIPKCTFKNPIRWIREIIMNKEYDVFFSEVKPIPEQYKNYCIWCYKNGFTPETKMSWNKLLTNFNHNGEKIVITSRRMINKDFVSVFQLLPETECKKMLLLDNK